jgi:hypothetical protein
MSGVSVLLGNSRGPLGGRWSETTLLCADRQVFVKKFFDCDPTPTAPPELRGSRSLADSCSCLDAIEGGHSETDPVPVWFQRDASSMIAFAKKALSDGLL